MKKEDSVLYIFFVFKMSIQGLYCQNSGISAGFNFSLINIALNILIYLLVYYFLTSSAALIVYWPVHSFSIIILESFILILLLNMGQSRTNVSYSPPSAAIWILFFSCSFFKSAMQLVSIFLPSQPLFKPSAAMPVIMALNFA